MRGCQRPKTRSFSAYSWVMPVCTKGYITEKASTSSADAAQVDGQHLGQLEHGPVRQGVAGHAHAGIDGLAGGDVHDAHRLLVVDGLARPQVGHGQEAVDLGVEHQAALLQVVDEVLADPGPTLGAGLALHLPQGPTERVALLGQPRVADHEVGREAAELLDHVGPGGPEVAHVGDVGLQGEGLDADLLQGVDQVEPVDVGPMEVHADGGGAVEAGGEGEGLPQAAVAAGAGDEDPLPRHTAGQVGHDPEALGIDGEGHVHSSGVGAGACSV